MKNLKWLWWILVIALALVVVAGVGFAGFQLGVAQSANFDGVMPFTHGRGFDDFGMRGGFRGHDFGGFGGGFGFFTPIFFLFRLAIFGGLIWLGYTLFKRSGWRLVKDSNPVAAAGDEKKESA